MSASPGLEPGAGAAGEPAVPIDAGTGVGGEGGAYSGVAGQSGADSSDPIGGLCTSCDSGSDCGGRDDDCLRTSDGEHFCGRDCGSRGCPTGYECVDVNDSYDPQCVPLTGTCIHLSFKPAPPPLADIQLEALDFINQIRADHGLYPYELDACLSALAQESAEELARTGDYLGKFERECQGQTSCECGWAGESESSMGEYDLRYDDVIERPVLERLSDSPNGEFVQALLSADFRRIGVGIVISGDEGWSAFSYGL